MQEAVKSDEEPSLEQIKEEEKSLQEFSKRKEQNSSFSFLRLFGYSYRESLELIRDPIRLTFASFGMIILMFVMGYGITMDVEDLNFAVLDQDKSLQSRNYIQNVSGSRYFLEKSELSSQNDLDEQMRKGSISVAFVIPPNFGKNLNKGYEEEIAVWIDGVLPFRAETIKGYVQGLNSSYLKQIAEESLGISTASNVDIQLRYRYNQDFKSIYSMVPAVIPMLLIFIPAILMALSIVREKELGSITNFYATPVTRFEFLIGKQIPYIFVSMISFLGLILFAIFIFGVPLKGSIITLSMGALLFVIVTTGLGMLVSSFAKTQIAALAATAIFTLLPTVNFSGLKEPVSSLEGAGSFIGSIFPASYFINISRGVFSKAVEFKELHFDFFVLAITIVIITILSILVLKKQEV